MTLSAVEHAEPLHPLILGEKKLPSNVWYAPLAGCSDWPYRMMVAKWRPGLQFTEMVNMQALIRGEKTTLSYLQYEECMHPIGAQMFGSDPACAKKAAVLLEDLGFDVIDLNCGCPVDKVTKKGGGSGLLKTPYLIGDIISSIVSQVSIPVTVKVRLGWDDEHINIEEVVSLAEQAGAKAIMVHGRTRKQGYSGACRREWIKRAKEAARHMYVIGNGDIFSPEEALSMMDETGCDGVLLARGAMGKPWLIEDIRRMTKGLPPLQFSTAEMKAFLLEHFEYVIQHKCEKKALLDLRRIGCWYMSNMRGAKAFRVALSRARSIEESKKLIQEYFHPSTQELT